MNNHRLSRLASWAEIQEEKKYLQQQMREIESEIEATLSGVSETVNIITSLGHMFGRKASFISFGVVVASVFSKIFSRKKNKSAR